MNFDILMVFTIAYFCHFIQVDGQTKSDKEGEADTFELDNQRTLDLSRQGYDDDLLTIPDDVSEARSKISYKPGYRYKQSNLSEKSIQLTSRNKQGHQVPETIIEDKKEDDDYEEDQTLIFSQINHSQTAFAMEKSKSVHNSASFYNVNSDSTFRGQFRRTLFKLYIKLRIYLDSVIDLMIIHSAKFALCAIFFVSVTHANLFNACLFVIFLLFSVSNYREVQKYWRISIIVDSLILISLYTIDVFKPQEIFNLDQATLNLIGIQKYKETEVRLLKYTPYLILLSILVITDYVLNSQRYEQFLAVYNQIELRDRLEDENNQNDVNQGQQIQYNKKIGVSDKLTKFLIKNSLNMMLLALFVECSLLPVSVLNFILLTLLCIISVKYMKSTDSIQLYSDLYGNLMALKWISIIFIFLKYMFQFEDFAYTYAFSEANKNKSYFEHLPLIEKLLGIENSLVPVKLFSLAIVMSISNLQLKFTNYKYLSNILREQDIDWKRSKTFDSSFKFNMHMIKTYLQFALYHVIQPLPVIFTIYYCLNYVSIIGTVLFSGILYMMYKQKEEFWKNQHIFISKLVTLALLITYGLQFIFLNLSIDENFVRWLGVEKQDERNNLIYSQLLGLFLILALCAFYKESQKLESLFTQSVQQKDINIPDENTENQKYQELQTIYTFETPIRQCLKFKNEAIIGFFYQHSHLLSISLLIIASLVKLNIVSIISSLSAGFLLNQKYYPNLKEDSIRIENARKRVQFLLKFIIVSHCLIFLWEYAMMLDSSTLINTLSWKQQIGDYFCENKNDECTIEFQQWLSLTNIPNYYIPIDFACLFALYISYQYPSGVIKVCKNDASLAQGDQVEEKDELNSKILQILLQSFPYVLIGYSLFFAATFSSNGTSDIISSGYLFFAMYMTINFRRLFTKNVELVEGLRKYNYFVYVLILIYQSPFFSCPLVAQTDPTQFIGREKCVLLAQSTNQNDLYAPKALGTFYSILSRSLGLCKISNSPQVELIIMFLLLEIQCYLFNHPAYETKVLRRMINEKYTDGRLRAFIYVESTHLKRIWAFKAIKQEIKILHTRLLRINSTISNQEFSRYLVLDQDQERNEEIDRLLGDDHSEHSSHSSFNNTQQMNYLSEDQAKLNEKIDDIINNFSEQIEDICLQLLSDPEIPVVPLNYINSSFRHYLRSNDQVKEELLNGNLQDSTLLQIQDELFIIIKQIQRQILIKNRIDLYNKEGLGLNFAIQNESEQYLNKGDLQFYKHMILHNKQENLNQTSFLEQYSEQPSQNLPSHAKRNLDQTVRNFMWNNFVNKTLFFRVSENNKSATKVEDQSFMSILGYSLLSNSQSICYFLMFLNFILNPNVTTIIPALLILIYALIDFPVANIQFFKFLMIYFLTIIAIKFTYQLPLFCGSVPYTLYFSDESCPSYVLLPEALLNRFDFVIGVNKFSGSYSYPRDQGLLMGLLGDLIVLLSLLVLKNYLIKIGIWHFVNVKNNIYQSPAFRCSNDELTQSEKIKNISDQNFQIQVYDRAPIMQKASIRIKKIYKSFFSFLLKIMPTYMNSRQRNLDIRSQENQPYIPHQVKVVKPGKDFFSLNFFSLLMILIFNLFWYRSVNGEQQSGAALSTANLQRFSNPQVGLIFSLLLLMMGERMLFRVRYFDQNNFSAADSGILGKHQLTIKFAAHLILVFTVHVYLGFLIPRHNMNTLEKLFPLIFCYLLWVIYFVGSALQIKYGYPQAPFKAPFTRDTSFFKVQTFRVFKAIPFLWEMKVIIDWTVTATCLDLFQWFKLDDAYNYLFWNKYQIDERKKKSEFAQRSWEEKFFQGFCFALGLIIVILAPILLFSGINPIMVKNPVQQGQLSISFELNRNGNTYSILQSQAFNIASLSESDVHSLSEQFSPINARFQATDMQKMHFSPYSETGWSISPPSLQKFIEDYNSMKNDANAILEVKSNWVFKRNNPVGNEATQSQHSTKMSILALQPIIDMLQQGLQTESPNNTVSPILKGSIFVENLFPKIFKLGSQQQTQPLEVQPMSTISATSSCELSLNRAPTKNDSASQNSFLNERGLYWTYQISQQDLKGVFTENQFDQITNNHDSANITQTAANLVILAFNEEVIGSLFGSAFQLSVVGLYATIVVAIGRFLRLIFDRISQRVIYEEMNHIEQLFEICEGIFIAQLEGDLVREKKLYELLIRIYRSPETLMKITERPHEKKNISNHGSLSQSQARLILKQNDFLIIKNQSSNESLQ